MITGKGWAIVHKRTLLVETVSPTRRAAIVNWLVVYAKKWVSNATTDAEIEDMWSALHVKEQVRTTEVAITAQ